MTTKLLYSCMIIILIGTISITAKEYKSIVNKTNTIELFTSEGCSSCPPADKWISKFTKDKTLFKEVIPLVFHIDYWDYIGWKDTFATKQYTSRQRRHQHEGTSSSVYTPEFIINNQEWKGWFSFFGRDNWPKSNEEVGILSLDHNKESNSLTVSFSPYSKHHKSFKLHVAVLGMGIESHIKRGENRGKALTHDFVVLSHKAYSLVDATYPSTLWHVDMPKIPNFSQKKSALVVWISEERSQKIIQITGGYLD